MTKDIISDWLERKEPRSWADRMAEGIPDACYTVIERKKPRYWMGVRCAGKFTVRPALITEGDLRRLGGGEYELVAYDGHDRPLTDPIRINFAGRPNLFPPEWLHALGALAD